MGDRAIYHRNAWVPSRLQVLCIFEVSRVPFAEFDSKQPRYQYNNVASTRSRSLDSFRKES